MSGAAVPTAAQLDAIQVALALRFGRTAGRRAEAPGIEDLLDEVTRWAAANPDRDVPWVAALLAVRLIEQAPYASNTAGVALMAMCITVARAGYDLEVDPGEVLVVMNELRRGRMKRPQLATWLARAVTRRPSSPPPTPAGIPRDVA